MKVRPCDLAHSVSNLELNFQFREALIKLHFNVTFAGEPVQWKGLVSNDFLSTAQARLKREPALSLSSVYAVPEKARKILNIKTVPKNVFIVSSSSALLR